MLGTKVFKKGGAHHLLVLSTFALSVGHEWTSQSLLDSSRFQKSY